MEHRSFVAIGHIVDDIEPYPHLGGGVSYSAIAAARLGLSSSIITRCPSDHPYISELESHGVKVFRLPSESEAITAFSNVYDVDGRRTQTVLSKQQPIRLSDIDDDVANILSGATILVAPVIGEVEEATLPELAAHGDISITPQGYFRSVDATGKVHQREWRGLERYMPYIKMIIMSTDDLSINGSLNIELLHEFIAPQTITVLTRGEQGASIFSDNEVVDIEAFPLTPAEVVDLTGSGDVFATAFISEFNTSKNIHTAGVSACLYAALKIMGISGGIGIESIPTRAQVKAFFKDYEERVQAFLTSNSFPPQSNLIFK